MQRFYEMIFIGRQDITANQVEVLAKQFTAVINEFGGDVTKTEFCGLRGLAYPIKKNRKGHYVLMNLAVSKEGLQEVERQMGLNEDVLRFLSIRMDQLDNAPSALMHSRNYREDAPSAHAGNTGRHVHGDVATEGVQPEAEALEAESSETDTPNVATA